MPITGTLDPTTQVFRTTLSGTITLQELSRHIATAQLSRAHAYPGLVDAREAQTVKFGPRELMRFAHHARELLEPTNPAPRAVVVDGMVHLGLARLFSSLVAGWMRVGVFECPHAAETWLADQRQQVS
jgi:hypothetical protein